MTSKFRQKLRKIKLLQALASLRITCLGIFLLFLLTLWGTIAQVQSGLYLAQERFFHSFYFLVLGFIPFPGGQLVMWILFINVLAVMLICFVYSWKNFGILVIHIGLLMFFVSGYVILNTAEESHVTLKEGQATNVSSAFHDWELAIWEAPPERTDGKVIRTVTGVDVARLKINQPLPMEDSGIIIKLLEYHRNANAYAVNDGDSRYLNASGVQKIEAAKLEKEPERNTPGIILEVTTPEGSSHVILYGAERIPTPIEAGGKTYHLSLRLKRYPMPFTLKLVEFIKEEHPGTQTARSFKSKVAVDTGGQWREKPITMNNPLRHREYTFYQSSFSVDQFRNESSTLAVVRNHGRVLPYISTFVTFAGLVIHFAMAAVNTRKRQRQGAPHAK